MQMKQIVLTPYNLWSITITVVLAWYCLVKGFFTQLFQAKETGFGAYVHQYLITHAYNQLYFVYERMVWLWFMAPVLLATPPSFLGLNDSTAYWILSRGIGLVGVVFCLIVTKWAYLSAVLFGILSVVLIRRIKAAQFTETERQRFRKVNIISLICWGVFALLGFLLSATSQSVRKVNGS